MSTDFVEGALTPAKHHLRVDPDVRGPQGLGDILNLTKEWMAFHAVLSRRDIFPPYKGTAAGRFHGVSFRFEGMANLNQVEAYKGIPRPFYEPWTCPHAQGHLRGQEGSRDD